jgi:hypothetical protein
MYPNATSKDVLQTLPFMAFDDNSKEAERNLAIRIVLSFTEEDLKYCSDFMKEKSQSFIK